MKCKWDEKMKGRYIDGPVGIFLHQQYIFFMNVPFLPLKAFYLPYIQTTHTLPNTTTNTTLVQLLLPYYALSFSKYVGDPHISISLDGF